MTNLAIKEARRRSRAPGPTSEVGFCKREVRECLSMQAGPINSQSEDAAQCWANAKHRHFTTDPATIPRGVPVFWTGGTEGHGHVSLGIGKGGNFTVDLLRAGFFDRTGIARVARTWRTLTLVGWAEDYDGVRVWRDGRPVQHASPTHHGLMLAVELAEMSHDVPEVRGEVFQ